MLARDNADRSERPSLDRLATAAVALLDVPLVLISIVDGPLQEIVGAHGLTKQGSHGRDHCALCRA